MGKTHHLPVALYMGKTHHLPHHMEKEWQKDNRLLRRFFTFSFTRAFVRHFILILQLILNFFKSHLQCLNRILVQGFVTLLAPCFTSTVRSGVLHVEFGSTCACLLLTVLLSILYELSHE